LWELIRANRRKSIFLVVVMAALLFAAGFAVGEILIGPGAGVAGLAIAFIVWMILTLVAFFQGKEVFMAIAGARKIEKKHHPRLFNIVEEMTIAAQLPAIPGVYIIDSRAPNAFATGRKPEVSAVAITTGLLNKLNRDELQGVIAHEIGHVKNRDILFMTMIGVMMGAIVLLADITMRALFWGGGRHRSRSSSGGGGQAQIIIMAIGLVLIIVAPIIARIIYLAASRKREYLADASAAQFTRFPEGLASALEKIAGSTEKMKKVNRAMAPMYIVNPLMKASGRRKAGLFCTHPPLEERIRILRSMAGSGGFESYDKAYRKITGSSSPVIPGSAMTGRKEAPRKRKAKKKTIPVPIPVMAAAGTLESVREPETHSGKVRETTNALWRSQGYRFIECGCGATLKAPASFKKPDVKCLRCGRSHKLSPPSKRGKGER